MELPGDAIVVFSDYVCPFCYLGKVSLESYRDEADDPPPVAWRPFDLRSQQRRPDGSLDRSIDTGKDEAYFEQVRDNVRKLREEYDVDMVVELDRDVDAYPAHRLALYVQREHADAFPELHDAIFDALWQDARDIGDPDVLRDLAADVGLEADVVDEALADEDVRDELDRRLDEARRVGVTGVPTFVHRGQGIPGAVPPERIAWLVEEAGG